jgi:hypothetical protein
MFMYLTIITKEELTENVKLSRQGIMRPIQTSKKQMLIQKNYS